MIPANSPDIVRGNASIIATISRPDRAYPSIEIKHRSEHGLHSVLPKTNLLELICIAHHLVINKKVCSSISIP